MVTKAAEYPQDCYRKIVLSPQLFWQNLNICLSGQQINSMVTKTRDNISKYPYGCHGNCRSIITLATDDVMQVSLWLLWKHNLSMITIARDDIMKVAMAMGSLHGYCGTILLWLKHKGQIF